MRRLIDSTYLFSVYRCIKGAGTSLDDVENFLRFVGEILIADHLLFTADETGPVYEPATKAMAEINSYCRSEKFIRHFSHRSVKYREICLRAARTLAGELSFVRPELFTIQRSRFEPHFTSSNPDERLAQLLESIKRGENASPPPLLSPATATQFVISQPEPFKALSAKMHAGFELDEVGTIAFAAAIRMLIYTHMGSSLKSDYLPATGRSRIHSLVQRVEHPYAQNLLESISKKSSAPNDPPIARAVSALVAINEGEPTAILTSAFVLRSKTSGARSYFRQEIPQDGCLIGENRLSRELKNAIDVQLGQSDPPSIFDALDPRLFLVGGLPAALIKVDKLGQWLTYKLRRRQTSEIASFLMLARKKDLEHCFTRLIHYSGVGNK